jgi:hypothetical protein
MTSNQIIHMSRVRAALRELGMSFDPKVAAVDMEYLQQALITAIEHPNADVQDSALSLAADYGLADEMRDVPFDAATTPFKPPRSESMAKAQAIAMPEFTSEEDEQPAPEPSALAFTPERLAVMRKYVGGMR